MSASQAQAAQEPETAVHGTLTVWSAGVPEPAENATSTSQDATSIERAGGGATASTFAVRSLSPVIEEDGRRLPSSDGAEESEPARPERRETPSTMLEELISGGILTQLGPSNYHAFHFNSGHEPALPTDRRTGSDADGSGGVSISYIDTLGRTVAITQGHGTLTSDDGRPLFSFTIHRQPSRAPLMSGALHRSLSNRGHEGLAEEGVEYHNQSHQHHVLGPPAEFDYNGAATIELVHMPRRSSESDDGYTTSTTASEESASDGAEDRYRFPGQLIELVRRIRFTEGSESDARYHYQDQSSFPSTERTTTPVSSPPSPYFSQRQLIGTPPDSPPRSEPSYYYYDDDDEDIFPLPESLFPAPIAPDPASSSTRAASPSTSSAPSSPRSPPRFLPPRSPSPAPSPSPSSDDGYEPIVRDPPSPPLQRAQRIVLALLPQRLSGPTVGRLCDDLAPAECVRFAYFLRGVGYATFVRLRPRSADEVRRGTGGSGELGAGDATGGEQGFDMGLVMGIMEPGGAVWEYQLF